jgi:hypothetical protein
MISGKESENLLLKLYIILRSEFEHYELTSADSLIELCVHVVCVSSQAVVVPLMHTINLDLRAHIVEVWFVAMILKRARNARHKLLRR